MTDLVSLLNDLAEFLDGQSDADGGPDGYRPNRAMVLLQDVEATLERIRVYQHKNPLGGPAKVFDAMAECIRAGDDYYAVLKDYGFRVALQDGPSQPVPVECPDTIPPEVRLALMTLLNHVEPGWDNCSAVVRHWLGHGA